jgi:hypothetical protein
VPAFPPDPSRLHRTLPRLAAPEVLEPGTFSAIMRWTCWNRSQSM